LAWNAEKGKEELWENGEQGEEGNRFKETGKA
jgi:hypothetical protein